MSLDIRTLEGKMRDILAEEYERETGNKSAEFIRLTKYRGVVSVDLAIAAMQRAVLSRPITDQMVDIALNHFFEGDRDWSSSDETKMHAALVAAAATA